MSEDDIIHWQDALESIQAGRTDGLKCPFCQEPTLVISQTERNTRVECTRCKHFIEGRFNAP
jgi:hypothetical protein